jgi:maleylpyruvate isomerase
MATDDLERLDETVSGCAAAHQRLLAWLDRMVDADNVDISQSSELPDWTVGHVLTHIARNADGCRLMLEGALAGEPRAMYPSREHRNADIEAGSARPFAKQVTDIRTAIWKLEGTWAQLDHESWPNEGLFVTGPIPASTIPRRRWREVEIHWSDMGLGHTWRDWSDEFVRCDLPLRRAERGVAVPAVVQAAGPHAELAWLFARPIGDGFPDPPPFA